ncbi:MAG: PhoH family protein, partial [Clostridia bacterium]|nr:PhoH family protein [Clostridia bacterium]
MFQKKITTSSSDVTARIFGSYDKNIARLESEFSVRIRNVQNENDDGDTIVTEGDSAENVTMTADVLSYLKRIVSFGEEPTDQSVDYVIGMVREGRLSELAEFDDSSFFVTAKGKPIKSKTVGQKKYIEAIQKNTVILGVGPAGTGKTYLAVASAVKALRAHEVSRIILTRPAVEAGERLGFLPGDLQSKIDPYLRPLYDALYEMLGPESCARMIEKMTIEIAPLAYMRGRTLDDSFIILDEAQNTTPEQMKMFLTRLGNGSKAVVTGDPTQTDLPYGKKSGLSVAMQILKGIDGIAVHEFTDRDVVRHRLVQKIILAYDKYDRERKVKEAERRERNATVPQTETEEMKKINIKITRRPRVKIYWANEQDKYDAGHKMKALIEKAIRGTLECENFDRDVIVSVTFTDNEGIREKN